jgi:hypothetical protein
MIRPAREPVPSRDTEGGVHEEMVRRIDPYIRSFPRKRESSFLKANAGRVKAGFPLARE